MRRHEVLLSASLDDWQGNAWRTTVDYAIAALVRAEVGRTQVELADLIAEAAAGAEVLVVDITRIGVQFADVLLRGRGLRIVPVMLTDQAVPQRRGKLLIIPRTAVMGAMSDILAGRRVKVEAPDGALIGGALASYTPEDPGELEDVAIACGLGIWWGERQQRSTVHQPPPPRLPVEYRPPTFDEVVERGTSGRQRR